MQIRAEMSEAQSALGRCEGVRSQEEGRALPAPPSGDGGGAAAAGYPAAGRRAAGRIHTWLDTLARMDADESRLLAKKNGLTPGWT